MRMLLRKQFVAAAVVLSLVAAGCSASTRHVAVTADTTLFEVISAIHSGEQTALCGQPSCAGNTKVENVPGWTLAKSQDFNRKLLPAAEAGRQFNTLLRGWRPGTPVPEAVTQAVTSLGQALSEVVKDFPPGTARDAILANIGVAQSVILTAFNIVLTVKGA